MFEWLDTGLGTIGALGVLITLFSWLNRRETNKTLTKQAEILKAMQDSTERQLKAMQDSTETHVNQMQERTETHVKDMRDSTATTIATMQGSLERMHTHFQESMQQMDANAGSRHPEVLDKLDTRR